MIESKEDIVKLLAENHQKIETFGISRLGLFGSLIRMEQSAQSDIGLIVEFSDGKKSYDNFIHLAYYLEDLFNRDVELVTIQSLKPFMKEKFLKDMEYVYINY